MSTKWTDNQLLAINARGGDVLVSAAAGSGKTAVLVERVLRMLTDPVKPVSIDRLLIVTYTRAAAAQLRERISSKLSELILANPDNRFYRRQLVLLPRAHISTVDSFCSDICREFFHELDINRDYKIAEQGQLSVLSANALEETLNELYEEKNPDFYELVKCFSNSKSDRGLGENILKLYEFLRSHPFFDAWLDEKLSYYTDFISASDSIWGRVILKNAKRIVDYGLSLSEKTIEISQEEPEFMSKVSTLLFRDKNYFQALSESIYKKEWDEIRTLVYSFDAGVLSAKGYKDHPIKLKAAANRDILKSCVSELKGLFEADENRCTEDIKTLYPIVTQMFNAVRVYDKKYSILKSQKNLADFSDVEHWALELLVKLNGKDIEFTPTATAIANRFDSVLVDEYQDANEVQDLIFKAVSKESNLFIVGDAKQSIYAFRQAMPEIFINRKENYPLYSSEEDNYPAKVMLEKNFRSRVELTDYVNFVFDRLMTKETGDIDYIDGEGLVSGASYFPANNPCAELHLIDADSFEDEDSIALEAQHIASVIFKELSETKVKDGEGERKCTFGDIAILLRSGKKNSSLYVRELEKFGIPATFESSSSFFDLPEIKMTVSILRVIDNPVQDIPLLSSMLSPVFGFTPDDLAKIRSEHRDGTLYGAVLKASQEENFKAKNFIESIKSLRTLAVTMTAEDFLNVIFERLGIISICACMGGDKAVNNLRMLTEYAAKFEQGMAKGINSFVSYLDRLMENGSDLTAAESSSDDILNAVRLMTVHSSKGLEFPICILAGTHKKFSTDTTDNVLLHSHLGFGAKRRDKILGVSYNTFVRKALAIEKKQSEMSEELRVLYVALTRAKEKLIMTAVKKNTSKYLSTLSGKLLSGENISPYIVSGAKSICDWLFMTALLHKDATLLRGIAKADDLEYSNNSSMLAVKVIDDIIFEDTEGEITREVTFDADAVGLDKLIERRFNFAYPHKELCSLPVKVTASELSHIKSSNPFEKILAKPKFLSGTSLTAAEKGTAMHKFLQFASFDLARKDLELEIKRLTDIRLSTSEAESLDREKLKAFIESDIVTDAIINPSFREYRFTVDIPVSLTGLSDIDDTTVILQGAVDLLIVKDGKITVVDYKTDRVTSTDILVERYNKQLSLYKVAVEACFELPCEKCLIYSVHLGEYKEV
ncbi:MAG: helicase-exonuclease AddAB subunit AddA [Clostridia bacterium]|nr:helicase-exonuclease AddAB subunit AddA [Clostridia bacterium]